MTRLRVALDTLGCRMNQYETAAMEESLRARGYQVVSFEDPADIYVINTCTVTGKSDYRSRQLARRAVKRNGGALVVLAGCYPQASPKEAARLEGVDLVLGNQEKLHLAERLETFIGANGLEKRPPGRAVVEVGDMKGAKTFIPLPVQAMTGHTRAFLKVQDGCNFRCAFCAITLARGPSRSLPPEAVVRQVETLVASGHREVVLTGVDLGSYGWDLSPKTDLAALVGRLGEVRGLRRLRISSLNPWEIPDPLIGRCAETACLCPHFHIPLQSGDDGVLRAMRRPYSSAHYEERLRRIKEKMPTAGIGADVIAGFPGESERAFERTLALIERLPISYLHVFPYSPRRNTPAARMEEGPPEVKAERAARLRELGGKKQRAFLEAHVGETVEVLIEHSRDKRTRLLRGLTENYIEVLTEGPDPWMNEFVQVRVEEVGEGQVRGRPGVSPLRHAEVGPEGGPSP